jgi:hypothetical protein
MTCFAKVTILALLCGLLNACGGGGGGANSAALPVVPVNGMAVVVNSGINHNAVNQLFASVTVCQPGDTSRCTTIDNVWVDTGSVGLRIFASVIPSSVNLPRSTADNRLPLLDCVQFVDNSYAWGPVATADVVMGDKTARSLPIQIIADPAYRLPNSLCSSRGSGTQLTTPSILGANGILGVGLSKEDCQSQMDCVSNPNNGSYFACTTSACTVTAPSTAAIALQVKHPVPLFASDNNGLLIDLPAVPVAGATQLNGLLIFGIGTQTNNQLTSTSLLTTDVYGQITTNFYGSLLTNSFIDSGSNGLYFDSALPACSVGSGAGFYCPSSQVDYSASLVGWNRQSAPVSFSVMNAAALFAAPSRAVLPALAGSMPGSIPGYPSLTFDWGLPFFYGRKVFIGIEGTVTPQGTGPFYAFN